MDFLRTILLVPLVVIAGLATIMVAGADASQPINVGMVAILAVALLAIAYLFVWHAVGSFWPCWPALVLCMSVSRSQRCSTG